MGVLLKSDIARYGNGTGQGMPKFQYWWRKAQETSFFPLKAFYVFMLRMTSNRNLCEFSFHIKCGPALYIGHPYCIVINPEAVIGSHVNIAKGVTIGQENRGKRKGVPTIGNNVWIGVNATIVGKITIGDDVLIAPNTLVNCDVPSHSIVYGNPCIVKQHDNATEGYL